MDYGNPYWLAFNNPMVATNKSFDSFHKALTGLGGTDEGALTGGSALRVQSLDAALKDAIAKEEDYKFWRLLRHRPIWSMVDYYNRRTDVGGYPRSGFKGETGPGADYNQNIARGFLAVSFIMHKGSVSWGAQNQEAVVDPLAAEQEAVMLRCARDAEYGFLEGDSSTMPNEFNSLRKEIEDNATADHIVDLAGRDIQWTDITNMLGFIKAHGNYGQITDAMMSNDCLADFENITQDLLRAPIMLTGDPGATKGQVLNLNIGAINTKFGLVTPDHNLNIREDKLPLTVEYNALIGETGAPGVSAGVVPVVAAGTTSFNKSLHYGRYYYLVIARNDSGFSNHVITAAADVTSGNRVTLTIQQSAGGLETCYEIYRSKKLAGTAAAPAATAGTDNYRRIGVVAKAAGVGAATFVDDNTSIPGTSEIYLITNKPEKDAIDIAVFAEPFQFPLASESRPIYPFLGILMAALRVTKPRQHAIIKNVLPTRSTWNPFKA
jgi:hypothetical protein